MICISCGATVPTAPFCCCCGARQSAITLEELYNSWKRMHYRTIQYKCMAGYESAWRSLSVLKDKPVTAITLDDYQQVMDSLSDRSLSLQKKLRSLISQLCGYASIRKIEQTNYAPYLILDGKRQKSREIFSDEEISRLFSYANAHERYASDAEIVLILIFTGLRPEELFAVNKDDIHLHDGYFVVRGSKTEAGHNRLIPIVPVVAPYFFTWLTRWPRVEALITTPRGCRVHLGNWRKRRYYSLLLDCGITLPDDPHRLVPYCARHTYATLADRAGVDKDTLAKMIGHTTYKTTKSIYIHERLDQFQKETEKVNRLALSFVA